MMLENTSVVTSYVNGTTINMDAISTKYFIMNLAISTIALCKECKYSKEDYCLELTAQIPHYDSLIEQYCDGIHGAVISNMLTQNIQIIYRFIQDCVLNETNRGLYLMQRVSRRDIPFWKILILAINEYKKLVERKLDLFNECIDSEKFPYDRYNEQFEELMTKG